MLAYEIDDLRSRQGHQSVHPKALSRLASAISMTRRRIPGKSILECTSVLSRSNTIDTG